MILVNSLFPQNSKENEALKYLVYKYPTVFALKGKPLTITPYYCHTIRQKKKKNNSSSIANPITFPLNFINR